MRTSTLLLLCLAAVCVFALTQVEAGRPSTSLDSTHPSLSQAKRFSGVNKLRAQHMMDKPKKKTAPKKKAAPKKKQAPKKGLRPGKATGKGKVTADQRGLPASHPTTNTAGPKVGAGTVQYTYSQSSGRFTGGGISVTGYSGRVPGTINNPAKQNVQAPCQSGAKCDRVPAGPIPRGTYTVSAVQASGHKRGPWTATLTPSPGNSMMGRSGFLIHGANRRDTATNHVSSTGCIILPMASRSQLKRGAILTVTQ